VTAQKDFDLILASASPRRKELLQLSGLRLKVIPADIDEENFALSSPEDIVRGLSQSKGELVAAKHPDHFVLAADTIVVIQNGSKFTVLGKPKNDAHAVEMLSNLSGREHQVYTGYHLTNKTKKQTRAGVVATTVHFAELQPAEIKSYVATGEPLDKAGAYGIQGIAGIFISQIAGSYSNVVGLPLAEVLADLKAFGVWNESFLERACADE